MFFLLVYHHGLLVYVSFFLFFFNDTATTEIYTLSLHDALPISPRIAPCRSSAASGWNGCAGRDRKSTRLNSSHGSISYAVFCLKKKKKPHNGMGFDKEKNIVCYATSTRWTG